MKMILLVKKLRKVFQTLLFVLLIAVKPFAYCTGLYLERARNGEVLPLTESGLIDKQLIENIQTN